MQRRYRIAAFWVTLAVACPALADQIKLTDGTEVSGTVLQRDGDSLIVELPRTSVQAVNGQPLPPPVVEGAPAPVFEAKDLAGQPQRVAGEGPVTLVQFWASWCGFCRSDLPTVKQVFSTYHGKGLRIVAVSIDDDTDALQRFVQKEQIPYIVVAAKDYPAIPDQFETRGIPTYFLIDRHGTIARIWRGSVTATKTNLGQAVAALLANPA